MAPQEDRFTKDEQLEFNFAEPLPWRCGSCGAPVSHGDICVACEKAFSAVLGSRAETTEAGSIESDPRASSPDVTCDENQPDHMAAGSVRPAGVPATPPAQRAARDRVAVGAVGAVLIAAVIGVPIGARWLQQQAAAEPAAPHRAAAVAPPQRQPSPAAVSPAAAVVNLESKAPKPAPMQTRIAGATVRSMPVQSPSRRPSGIAAAPQRATTAPAKAARPASVSPAPLAPAPSPAATVDTPVSAAANPASPPPSAASPEPQPVAAPEAPAGRLFDVPEVDEVPRILTRIEPRLPADLQGRTSADVVIVRVLVSHTGHPFRVTLLRRSRLGPSADEAVIAAVRRWTFSAARKRGEPVSCWYNLAVPLSIG